MASGNYRMGPLFESSIDPRLFPPNLPARDCSQSDSQLGVRPSLS